MTTTNRLVRVGQDGVSRSGLQSDRNNFGPRFGFNWSPGDGLLTTLHGAYGIFYDASTLVSKCSARGRIMNTQASRPSPTVMMVLSTRVES